MEPRTLGGRDAQTTPLAVVEVFDPVAGTWAAAAPLATARYWFGGAVGADGRIYVAGGIGDAGFLDDAEALTPGGASWTTLPAMPEARGWMSAAGVKDGRVLAIGGSVDDGSGLQPPPMKTMLAFDPKASLWSK